MVAADTALKRFARLLRSELRDYCVDKFLEPGRLRAIGIREQMHGSGGRLIPSQYIHELPDIKGMAGQVFGDEDDAKSLRRGRAQRFGMLICGRLLSRARHVSPFFPKATCIGGRARPVYTADTFVKL